MLNDLDLSAVKTFLKICKKEIKQGNCYFVSYRKLNINGRLISAKQALIDIGIMNKKEIWNHILNLEVKDFIKMDRDHDIKKDENSEIFIFKKRINNKMVYIKLTMNNKGIVCISFHEDY